MYCVFECVCLSVSEPPLRLWPAGCWEHGEGGWALETSPSTAWVCGGGGHPAEQVTHQQLCKSFLFWVRASPDFFSSITLHLFLSQFACWFSRTLISIHFLLCCALLILAGASCSPPPLSSLVLTVFRYVFIPLLSVSYRIIHPGSVLTSAYETTGCSSEGPRHVVYVEHVVVRITIIHSHRGDLSITLMSPAGTVSQLLAHR